MPRTAATISGPRDIRTPTIVPAPTRCSISRQAIRLARASSSAKVIVPRLLRSATASGVRRAWSATSSWQRRSVLNQRAVSFHSWRIRWRSSRGIGSCGAAASGILGAAGSRSGAVPGTTAAIRSSTSAVNSANASARKPSAKSPGTASQQRNSVPSGSIRLMQSRLTPGVLLSHRPVTGTSGRARASTAQV